MDARKRDPSEIDHWLRQSLDPDPETLERITGEAASAGRAPGKGRYGLGRPIFVTGLLAAAFLLLIRLGGQDTAGPAPEEAIRIVNHGELLSVIDPAGATWLRAPARPVADSSPRLIITLGGIDAQ